MLRLRKWSEIGQFLEQEWRHAVIKREAMTSLYILPCPPLIDFPNHLHQYGRRERWTRF